MQNNIKVKIAESANLYVKKLYYEYNISLNIVSFLMQQENINEEYLEKYLKSTEKKGMELEEAKKTTSALYCPNSIVGLSYNYEFLFDEEAIIYNVQE